MSERPFSFQRGVGNRTKDNELSFIRNLGNVAEGMGIGLHASLGMSALELVRRSEIRPLLKEYPGLKRQRVEDLLDDYKNDESDELGKYKSVDIAGSALFVVENGVTWLGGVLTLSSKAFVASERRVMEDLLCEASDCDITLPERELFVNIGIVEDNVEAVEPLLKLVSDNLPNSLFLYDVHLG